MSIQILLRIFMLHLFFFVILLVITAQPSENPARAFFDADDCPMPCWHGIRPGITPRAEAEAMLAAHPWIELSQTADLPDVPYSGTYDLWLWAAAFPFPIPINRPDIRFTDGVIGYLDRRREGEIARVGGIEMTTGLRLGDVWRLLGAPRSIASEGYVGSPGNRLHEIRFFTFDDLNIQATAYQSCPISLHSLLNSPVTLQLSPNPVPAYRAEPILPTLYRLLRLRQVSVCGGVG
jgi:hypothetical protein